MHAPKKKRGKCTFAGFPAKGYLQALASASNILFLAPHTEYKTEERSGAPNFSHEILLRDPPGKGTSL
jgi:hypothetical protein